MHRILVPSEPHEPLTSGQVLKLIFKGNIKGTDPAACKVLMELLCPLFLGMAALNIWSWNMGSKMRPKVRENELGWLTEQGMANMHVISRRLVWEQEPSELSTQAAANAGSSTNRPHLEQTRSPTCCRPDRPLLRWRWPTSRSS